ncbi:hypothetical protein BP6252_01311 [Coleophoma cylindrospora]|uniref:alpha-1,3-glucan synthase n=1 Tax=Coleophoma cylindrospora TaxID=1849047 RepID=A0A3D8SSH8_9HELO|nr:hypothetical protein BP6252_01311 [Coleophoma cylindrospora]
MSGNAEPEQISQMLDGKCFDGDFNQHGSTPAFDQVPDWQRAITNFGSVQDRLKEWKPDVLAKIQNFACITINMLDIDGFRIDKATQLSVYGQSEWSDSVRQCAKKIGKDNFFIPGEITGGDSYGSVFLGRGRTPDNYLSSFDDGLSPSTENDPEYFIRPHGKQALDSAAFHYTFYRRLCKFLGLVDSDFTREWDLDMEFVDMWNSMVISNDFGNANTGEFDPRHLWGVDNQDLFRWPAIVEGLPKQLVGQFLAALVMPGAPLILWGDEQAFYVLDNTDSNYPFGRQAMSSAVAWKLHGCYTIGVDIYYAFPLEKTLSGCHDDWNILDHRDPTAAPRLILKDMFNRREQYPALKDGFDLTLLSSHTHFIYWSGTSGSRTEKGLWSVKRGSTVGQHHHPIWLLYSNENTTVTYNIECGLENSIRAPFPEDTIVKSLFYPFEEYVIQASTASNGVYEYGCLPSVTIPPYGYAAFVSKKQFIELPPAITHFSPGHDARILSSSSKGDPQSIEIMFTFTSVMNCTSVLDSISIVSTTDSKQQPILDRQSVNCSLQDKSDIELVAQRPGIFMFKAVLTNVFEGIHRVTVENATAADNKSWTGTTDHFLFRLGQLDNPVVFPMQANYSLSLLQEDDRQSLMIAHTAAGSDSFRYSFDFGLTYSDWEEYSGAQTIVNASNLPQGQSSWNGQHVIVQYFTRLGGSSSHVQHSDLIFSSEIPIARRFPTLFVHGNFNKFGYDTGIDNSMTRNPDGTWTYHHMDEWPSNFALNIWGSSKSGKPNNSFVYGDLDEDGVLDRIPPYWFTENTINVSSGPAAPFLSWRVSVNDATLTYELIPVGSQTFQKFVFWILACLPILTALLAVRAFHSHFYRVVVVGASLTTEIRADILMNVRSINTQMNSLLLRRRSRKNSSVDHELEDLINEEDELSKRTTVLLATLEYSIPSWNIEVKIGGLGVMAHLMGQNLESCNLIWVVPCLGGIEYPEAEALQPIEIVVKAINYSIDAYRYIQGNGVTYILLDAPIFRRQTKAQPYPARDDDLRSAIFYSAWNQATAEVMRRFPVDVYHANDFHGALAPIYLLPDVVPVCLSLHNAEFQVEEICSVFNVSYDICSTYIQFGDSFNLLHAGASYLRLHQRGFGAVGVSELYGKRSRARYPIFWGLKEIGALPNPDPSDRDDLPISLQTKKVLPVNVSSSNDEMADNGASRTSEKTKLQNWAGLKVDASVEILVFVGRWSAQKGIDLIADIAPKLLQRYNIQIVAVGPIVDVYGKFAATKFIKLMEKYPGRVFSKPEFISLPTFLFSGADFVLIPSRDEPFGLVAVEFGRKGILGIGAQVGGLGQMPGWWYTVESASTEHLTEQFEAACAEALASKESTRAMMRERGKKQRFPVSDWLEQTKKLRADTIVASQGTAPLETVNTSQRFTEHNKSNEPWVSASTMTLTSEYPLIAVESVLDGQSEGEGQNLDPIFTDADGQYQRHYVQELEHLTTRNSTTTLCIENFIARGRKIWFNDHRLAKMGMHPELPVPSLKRMILDVVTRDATAGLDIQYKRIEAEEDGKEQVQLRSLTSIQRLLLYKIGDWPIYSFLLALGQIIGGEASKLSLLTDPYGRSGPQIYETAIIYLVSSVFWWILYRQSRAAWVMILPFGIYATSFFLLGLSEISLFSAIHDGILNLAILLYSSAASSTCLYFSLNFGDEGGVPIKDWVFRASAIQGIQQFYVAVLWYAGSRAPDRAISQTGIYQPTMWWLPLIFWPIAAIMCGVAYLLYHGLPEYYHYLPAVMPTFYTSTMSRKIVIWFLLIMFTQNYWLSPLFGRNLTYLWSSRGASPIQILLLIVLFYVIIWHYALKIFHRHSVQHSWLMPLFAIGLGAPRWGQMLWSTSKLGAFVPWFGANPNTSAIVSRSLWLWLGNLDATLTRVHLSFTLLSAQVIGSFALILSKFTAPDRIGPGTVFPDLSGYDPWGETSLPVTPMFYIAFFFQIFVCFGFFFFFRAEQLWKP